MADFLSATVSQAVVKDGKVVKPAVHEIILLQKAIDESGKEVNIRGQKIQATEEQIDQRIAQLEAEVAKWKSIKAGL